MGSGFSRWASAAGLATAVLSSLPGVAVADSPLLSLSVDRPVIGPGESVRVSWATSGARYCRAWQGVEAWRTVQPVEGAARFTLDQPTTFKLNCRGSGGFVSRTVSVDVGKAPTLSLTASRTTIESGEATRLDWQAAAADSCTASDGWRGDRSTSGRQWFRPDTTRTFSLSCSNAFGAASRSVTVDVAEVEPEPVPEPVEPSLSLQASATTVSYGSSAELSWDSEHASGCSAGGGWQGTRPAEGRETVGPMHRSATFSLTCSGAGGNAVSMVSIVLNDRVTLNWQAPSQNDDGSRLVDLASYRIYYGLESGAYEHSIDVSQASASSHSLNLPSGDYYFAMTAVDTSGNESRYSNEVTRRIP